MRILGSQFRNIVNTATDYVANPEDEYIGVTNTDTERTITLATPASVGRGKTLVIKDESGVATAHPITISAGVSYTIDGAASYEISNNYCVVILYCTGTAWFVISEKVS